MGPARPTSLKEEATINLYISHAHCSAATPTTTYTVAPRGEAQTHLSNTKMKPPLPALPKSKYKYLVVQQQPPSQSGTDKCKALVQSLCALIEAQATKRQHHTQTHTRTSQRMTHDNEIQT